MAMILLGYRGCGKTTIGKRLADRLWTKFVDTDDLITATSGKTVRQLFEEQGEAHFRQLEADAVERVLEMKDYVIALGGGAVLRRDTRDWLRASSFKRLYLRCDPQELLRRIQSDPASPETRPDLTNLGGGIEEIAKVLADREPLYRQVMTAELDVTNLTPEEAVVRLVRLC